MEQVDYVATQKPAVATELRRPLFNDPEFPYWTKEPQVGSVFAHADYDPQTGNTLSILAVITDVARTETGKEISCRFLKPDGSDDNRISKFQMILPEGSELKIMDRMYSDGPDKSFRVDLVDYVSLMASPPARIPTHKDKLPEDNLLANLPFWGGPGGKNLTILACLEWALTHIAHESQKLPCAENSMSTKCIQAAIDFQKLRQETRSKQRVLGTTNPHATDDEELFEIYDCHFGEYDEYDEEWDDEI